MANSHGDVFDVSPATATPGATPESGGGGHHHHHGHGHHADDTTSSSSSIEFVAEAKPLTLLGPYELRETLKRCPGYFVKLGRHTKNNTLHEVRVYSLSQLRREPRLRLAVEREVLVLRHLRHPYIQRLDDVQYTAGHLYVVLEFCAGGDLLDALTRQQASEGDGGVPQSIAANPGVVARLFLQLMQAVAFLHAEGIVHRDIKLENLLLDDTNTLKLSGFHAAAAGADPTMDSTAKSGARETSASAQRVSDWVHNGDGNSRGGRAAAQTDFRFRLSCGSCHYASPEVISVCAHATAAAAGDWDASGSDADGPSSGTTYDGRALDVWACGVTLFALATGMLPFLGDSDGAIFGAILRHKYHDAARAAARELPPHLAALVDAMLDADPKRRLSAGEVLRHSYWSAVPSAVRAAARSRSRGSSPVNAPPAAAAGAESAGSSAALPHTDTMTPQQANAKAARHAAKTPAASPPRVSASPELEQRHPTTVVSPAQAAYGGYAAQLAARRARSKSGERAGSGGSTASRGAQPQKVRHVARAPRGDWV